MLSKSEVTEKNKKKKALPAAEALNVEIDQTNISRFSSKEPKLSAEEDVVGISDGLLRGHDTWFIKFFGDVVAESKPGRVWGELSVMRSVWSAKY